MTIEEIKERILEQGLEDVMIFTEPDYADAFLGFSDEDRAVYSYTRMIECLMERGWTHEEAVDFFDVNTLNSLRGNGKGRAPIVLFDDDY